VARAAAPGVAGFGDAPEYACLVRC